MPDDNTSEGVEQNPFRERPAGEMFSPPPNDPNGPIAQSGTDNRVEKEVQAIKGRVKRAEVWMIGLTFSIALFALCAVVVGILQWNAMRGQLAEMKSGGADTHDLAEAAKKQAGVAATQLEMSERPWISAEITLASPLTFDAINESMKITLAFAIKNTGYSPALNVSYYAEMFPLGGGIDPVAERTKLCDRMGNGELAPLFGDTIFPGDHPLERDLTIGMSHKAVTSAAKGSFISPVVIACVDYQYSFSSQHRQTRYGFDLIRVDTTKPGAAFAIETFKDVPAQSLHLHPWPYGTAHPDSAASYAN
jgi:hypothetical protein